MSIINLMRNSYLVGFIVAIVAGLIVFFALGYFNVIPSFKLFSKQASFLSKLNSQSSSLSKTSSQATFPCPVEGDNCQKAEAITESKTTPNYQGLGYQKLTAGVNVSAIISGQYQVQDVPLPSGASKNSPGFVNIEIQNHDYIVTYMIAGGVKDLSKSGQVTKDQIIASLSGMTRGQIQFGKLYNMAISIKDLKTGQFLKLTSSKDGISTER